MLRGNFFGSEHGFLKTHNSHVFCASVILPVGRLRQEDLGITSHIGLCSKASSQKKQSIVYCGSPHDTPPYVLQGVLFVSFCFLLFFEMGVHYTVAQAGFELTM